MREQAGGSDAPADGAIDRTDSVGNAEIRPPASGPTPRYANDRTRDLGEKLAAAYAARDRAGDPKDRKKAETEVSTVRAKLRKGPRLVAGEFLQDGRYRLLDRLGSDASSERWQGWDRLAGEPVVVEVMLGEWVEDDALVDAFVERASALSAIHHPRVARVLDATRTDDGFVYVASRVGGVTPLASVVGAKRLQSTDALQVLVEIAEALGAVHAAGAVHGGLAPSAVLLSEDGAANLTGFRLVGSALGNSLYAAPEAMAADQPANPAGDVYALGMVAAFLLFGQDLPYWVVRDPERLVASLDTRESVRQVIRRCTAWDVAERYASVAPILDALLSDDALVEALAERAWSRGRPRVAAAHWEVLLKLRPERASALHTRLGEVYLRLQEHEGAFQHLSAALELAVASAAEPDVEKAIAPLITLLRAQAVATGDWSRLARALWGLGRRNAGPRRAIVRAELARINQHQLGDPVAAAETWSQVLMDHHTAELARAALEALSKLAEARGDWAQVVAFDEELMPYLPVERRAEVQFGIGRAYLEHLGDEDAALEWIDRAEAGGHRTLVLADRVEEMRSRRGQWPRVIELMLRQAEVRDTEQVSRALLRAGIIARSVHLDAQALQVYEQLLQRIPGHVVALRELARMHYRRGDDAHALRYFQELVNTFSGRKSEDSEAGERASDLVSLAKVLLRAGNEAEAVARLGEAIKLAPDLVPALELVAPLHLLRGETEQAGRAWERLYALYRGADADPARNAACVGLGEVAWAQGKLAMALGWYNRVVEVEPESHAGWWGLARVALAVRGGHPGGDRAPWLRAVPRRFTVHEALARLVAGAVRPESAREWLSDSPFGAALLSGGDSSMRLALAVVDVAHQHGQVRHLLEALASARPAWRVEIDAVRAAWEGGGVDARRACRWSAGVLSDDFDADQHRDLLAGRGAEVAGVGIRAAATRALPPFARLMAGDVSAPLAAQPAAPHARGAAAAVPMVVALIRDGRLLVALDRDRDSVVVGSGADADGRLVADGVAAAHLRLERVGRRVYLSAQPGLTIDGEATSRRRLDGQEALQLGGVSLTVAVVPDLEALPQPWESELVPPSASSSGPTLVAPLPEPVDDEDPPASVSAVVASTTVETTASAELAMAPATAPSADAPDRSSKTTPSVEVAEVLSSPPRSEPVVASASPGGTPGVVVADLGAELAGGSAPPPLLGVVVEVPTNPGIRTLVPEDPDDAEDDEVIERPAALRGAATGVAHAAASDLAGVVGADDDDEVVPSLGEVRFTPPPIRTAPPIRMGEAIVRSRTPGPSLRQVKPTDSEPAMAYSMPSSAVAPESVVVPAPAAAVAAPAAPAPGPATPAPEEGIAAPLYLTPEPVPARTSGRSLEVPTPALAVKPGLAAPARAEVAPVLPPPASEDDFEEQVTMVVAPPDLQPSARRLRAVVEVMSGPARGASADLDVVLRVGSSPDSDLPIVGDSRLDAHHCKFRRTEAGFVLEDAGSVAGTVMNGTRVTEAELIGGEVIMVGRTVLRFRKLD